MKRRNHIFLFFLLLTLVLCLSLCSCKDSKGPEGTQTEKNTSSFDVKEPIALAAPTGLSITDDILTWSPVEGADGYTVLCEGEKYSTDTERLDIFGIGRNPKMEYSFTVIANGSKGVSSDSAASAPCLYRSNATSGGISFGIPEEDIDTYYVAYVDDPSKVTGKIYIPSEYNGYPVLEIMDHGFSNCTGITGIVIEEGVKRICANAFEGCTELTRVSLPDSMVSLYHCAFLDCEKLTSLHFPEKVSTVIGSALAGCSSISSLSISPENKTYRIEENCLIMMKNDELILYAGDGSGVLPSSVKSIGSYAFYRSPLEQVILHEGITRIGECAFSESSIKAPVFPITLKSIEREAFSHCEELTKIIIRENVVRIGVRAFYNCPSLALVSIPSSVQLIEGEAFSGLQKATVMLSAQIPILSNNVFTGNEDVVVYIDYDTENQSYWPTNWGSSFQENIDNEITGWTTWKGHDISFSANCVFDKNEDGALYVAKINIEYRKSAIAFFGGAYGGPPLCFCDHLAYLNQNVDAHIAAFTERSTGIPAPVREGYTFLGWALEENGEIIYPVYEDGRTLSTYEVRQHWDPDADRSTATLYAVWEKN